MDIALSDTTGRLQQVLKQLTARSTAEYYNPYTTFNWPESLSSDALWMSPELLSVHNTQYQNALSSKQLFLLNRYEGLNFYSTNVHGIKALLVAVIQKLYTPGFERYSEYLGHFIGEENEHMWFFAQLCMRYAGGLYPNQKLVFQPPPDDILGTFIVFSQILIFEEIGHFYNKTMMVDEALPSIIRQINKVHHDDESRHLGMGHELLRTLYREVELGTSRQDIEATERYLKAYVKMSMEAFYNPRAYQDAGIDKPYEFRRHLLENTDRQHFHAEVLKRVITFFANNFSMNLEQDHVENNDQ